MPVHIQQIATALPPNRFEMDEVVAFLSSHATDNLAARKVKVLAQKSGIITRYAVIEDFREGAQKTLYKSAQPAVEDRMSVYQNHALPLALKAVHQLEFNPSSITHVITVSCTGMSAPGLELELAESLKLNRNCVKHAVNFIGCHGVFHALKIANSYAISEPEAKVLIVSVELCSLHYQPTDDDDSILSNVLFGDGAAACIVSSATPKGRAIKLDKFEQLHLPDNSSLMAWNISSNGFLLKLSSYVPKAISHGIPALFNEKERLPELWAVHPGGKSILEALRGALSLSEESLQTSEETLSEVGNLSSATILFVLEKHLKSSRKGSLLALGFGPGLTIEKLHAQLSET